MEPVHHWIATPDGWQLDAKNYRRDVDPGRPPIVFVPGYCMNTFPLAFHPRGVSLVEFLAARGFDVWTVNLRGQGDSKKGRHAGPVGFSEIACRDLPVVCDFVRDKTQSELIDLGGCSLGGTFVFTYLAHHLTDPGIRKVVGLGAPLTWVQRSLLMKTATAAPGLLGALPLKGTRRLAKHVLPVAKRIPGMLSMYMNTDRIDLSRTDELVKTVDDPDPRLNAQIARWVQDKELTVDDLNVSRAMADVQLPYLGIYGNADGIVFPSVARAAGQAFGGEVELVEAGSQDNQFGHADLFINDEADSHVFEPLVAWLAK